MVRGSFIALALPIALAACSGDDPAQPERLRVITYNVKGLDWTPGSTPAFPEAVRLEDLVTTLAAHPADVIGLQEVRQKDEQRSLADDLAEALGGYHVATATTTSIWMPYVQQNAILSRYPLADAEELDLGEDPGGTEHRRFQYARIELPGGTVVHLGNIHMFTDGALQRPALEAVARFLEGRVGSDDLLVWTGDFNTKPSADPMSPYGYVTGEFSPAVVDPQTELGRPLDPPEAFTSSAEDPRRRIDYIFVSPAITVLDYAPVTDPVPNRAYPDHLAVEATLQLPAPGAPR